MQRPSGLIVKNFRPLLLALLAAACLLCAPPRAAAEQPAAATARPSAKKPANLKVLCTTFPVYLFTRMAAEGRDGLSITLMLPANAGCPHDHALTPQDMRLLARADALVINGLGMEAFLGKAVAKANPKIRTVDSSKGIENLLPLSPETDGDGNSPHHHASVYNPHLFASPLQAAAVTRGIARALAELDPDGAAVYEANAARAAKRLEALAQDFRVACSALPAGRKKIVSQHAVFDYLARDAGLQIAAVVEEEPGRDPVAAEMLKIVERIRKSGAGALFTEPQYPGKVSETIAREAGIPVAQLDPVATGPADAAPDYYEKTMRRNLATLTATLGKK